jgi:hypothetical protein
LLPLSVSRMQKYLDTFKCSFRSTVALKTIHHLWEGEAIGNRTSAPFLFTTTGKLKT